jgi:hypothetical protein
LLENQQRFFRLLVSLLNENKVIGSNEVADIAGEFDLLNN